MSAFYLSLCLWFFFYLGNHAEITANIREYAGNKLHSKIKSMFKCAFCFAFHTTILITIFLATPFYWVFCVPVLSLFCELLYQKLKLP